MFAERSFAYLFYVLDVFVVEILHMLFNLKIKQMADESENRPDTITEEEEGGDNEAAAAVSEPVIDATEEETKTGDEQGSSQSSS